MIDVQHCVSAELILSPKGEVYLSHGVQSSEQLPSAVFERIKLFFDKGASIGLLQLGIQDFSSLPASFLFWQMFSRRLITAVCKFIHVVDGQKLPDIPVPDQEELHEITSQALLIKGGEYLNPDVLRAIWQRVALALQQELQSTSCSLQEYLQQYNSRWNLVGRVCFHLAENKNHVERPFAFLATYTTKFSQHSTPQHLPLKRALQDYGAEKERDALLSLLLPIQKAAAQSRFIKELVDSGAVFQPQTWTANQAHQFLREIPLMEASGLVVRVPNWWNTQKPSRPQVVVTLGKEAGSLLGLRTLLDMDMHLALGNGEQLTREEWQSLCSSKENFIKIKGQWVEINREKLETVLSHWDQLKSGAREGLSLGESLRLLTGEGPGILSDRDAGELNDEKGWSVVRAGDWLQKTLDQLKNPEDAKENSIAAVLKQYLRGTLRPYQQSGVKWLWLLYQLKLGGCLADDMGLGKTIQVLSLLLMIKHALPRHPSSSQALRKPHLLVVPASLLGNWKGEIGRFAPSLKVLIAHPSETHRNSWTDFDVAQLKEVDLVITTYAFVLRLEWLKEMDWDLLILDEAQLIKNPGAKQTRAVKVLKSQMRLTLTGTPVENRLGDLWSLFDFTSPGLLGSSKVFSGYAKQIQKENMPDQRARLITALRELTQPYILRRLKTDKKIISDLPDKTEMQCYCSLSKEQVHLYQQAIKELSEQLKEAKGLQRRGLVLAYLMRFKQICNHPVQWLGYGEYAAHASGKFLRLKEICEEIAAKQEKVLIFTQFKEVIAPISDLLTSVFGRPGLILHGDTAIHKRPELVESFQSDQGAPFFVLSLKAGGTGLNLTAASHVIHFDRWWNPAVENQATDRAYRIGQKRAVLVHKFICRGTVEDKIDALIVSKKDLSREVLEGGGELSLTELSNEELLKLISLDIHEALRE
ncbi:MAG: DEAD/DEAH box helicase [Chlamydiales bacterium]